MKLSEERDAMCGTALLRWTQSGRVVFRGLASCLTGGTRDDGPTVGFGGNTDMSVNAFDA